MITKERLVFIRAAAEQATVLTGLATYWKGTVFELLEEVDTLQQKETKTEVEIVFRDWDKQADHCKEIGLSIERSCFGSCAAFWSHCLAFDDICNNSSCRDLREKLDDK